jgi:glucose-6-phosphate 1-dehydrogenase
MNALPTSLIIFGATGDLMGKKIVPSLWHLYKKGTLPLGWNVIGISRRDLSDDAFRALIKEFLDGYVSEKREKEDEEKFLEMFSFARVAFESDRDFEVLAALLDEREEKNGPANRLIYMAVPPEVFPAVFAHRGFGTIVKHGEDQGGHTHVIIEKPFGTDRKSAEELEEVLARRFVESQLYRADHYLAKQVLRAIPHFRFGSETPILEHLWNKDHISKIHIRTWETLGLESRGAFYDPLGTLRDVGQNHLLEMMALVTMEKPHSRDPGAGREARAEMISKLRPMTEQNIREATVRAQYDGYTEIQGVAAATKTETYYALKAFLDTPRWEGVPIIMEAGKRMAEWRTEIIITLKDPAGEVIIRMRPQEEMLVTLGEETKTIPLPPAESTAQYVAEYARILMDAALGDPLLFIDTKEIDAAWAFVDPIVAGWKNDLVPLQTYEPGTNEAAVDAMKKLSAM